MYLGIVETESGSPRLSRDLILVCNLCMQLLDSSVGAFAITSFCARFAAASLLYWRMCFKLRSCTSGTVIVRSQGCCDSGSVIPLFKDRCSAKDNYRTASCCAVSTL